MDNQIPPVPPVSPSLPQGQDWPKILLIVIGFLVILGLFGNLYFLAKNQKSATEPTPTPIATTLTPTPDPTADWKIYTGETVYTTDGSSKFSIKYPSNWDIQGDTLYPYKDDKLSRIQLGAGGTEGPLNWKGVKEIINFPAGKATLNWDDTSSEWLVGSASFPVDKYSYLFDVTNIPADRNKEIKEIFIKMLSTFKFLP